MSAKTFGFRGDEKTKIRLPEKSIYEEKSTLLEIQLYNKNSKQKLFEFLSLTVLDENGEFVPEILFPE